VLYAISDFLMADLKQQRICVEFYFKIEKSASETRKILKTAFVDEATGK
jgi:hypothetical protein